MTARPLPVEHRPGDRGQNGFTLVEVLAALTVLALVMTGILALFSQAVATLQMNADRLTATHLARSELAKWLAQPGHDYATLKARVDAEGGTLKENDPLFGPWEREVTVTRVAGLANPPLKVTFTVAGRRGVSITLYTLITP